MKREIPRSWELPPPHGYCLFHLRRIQFTLLSYYPLLLLLLQHHQRARETRRETLILIQSSNSIERETESRRPNSAIPDVLRTGSTCAQRGNFARIWEPANTACECDTSLTNSAAPFSRCRNAGSVARTLATRSAILFGTGLLPH